jgi:oxygen-independent coproporphyrinogen-3 oxidase
MNLGLYCHVPFCAVACDFCAFYQQQPRPGDFDRFLSGIERELTLAPPDRPADTFFWGGGTPGLLPPDALRRLGNAFLRANTAPPREWTIELSPGTVRPARLAALRELGVTRISMGVQSFDSATLAALGRKHLPRQIFQAWDWIREAGFRDTSLDLIFAIPGQDEARWRADLAEAVRLAPDHISTYCLTLEEDTALYARLARGKLRASEEQEAALYRSTWHFLDEHGYAQYEISNFARPGHACLHNLHTWGMEEWLGYGPAAASQWRGRRFQNPANLEHWQQGLAAGVPVREQVVELTPEILFADAIIFGLRKNEGVVSAALEERFGIKTPDALADLISHLGEESYLLQEDGGIWRLTLEGRLRADAIGAAVLEAI